MKIMAIDPSLTAAGYCILDTENNFDISKAYSSKNKGMQRLKDIRDFFLAQMSYHRPEHVFIEGYAFAGNRATDMGEVGGILRLAIFESKIPLTVIPPMQLKKYVCGTGLAKKELMLMKCLAKFKREFESNDACDAYCLARFGAELLELGREKFIKKHKINLKEGI